MARRTRLWVRAAAVGAVGVMVAGMSGVYATGLTITANQVWGQSTTVSPCQPSGQPVVFTNNSGVVTITGIAAGCVNHTLYASALDGNSTVLGSLTWKVTGVGHIWNLGAANAVSFPYTIP